MINARTVLLFLATILLTTGCSEPGEPAAPPPPAAGGPAATARLTLPSDFPDAVPLLPRRRFHWFWPRNDGSLSLTCSVPEGRRQAAEFYREALASGAWEVTLDSLSGGMTTFAARRQDGSRLTVNIIESNEGQRTIIGIYYGPGSP